MDAEERQKNITNIKVLLESINEHIRIKQLRIQKLKTCNDFQQCDVISKETTELLTQKLEYENQLAALEKKEKKSKWYKKKAKSVKRNSSELTPQPTGIVRMLSNASNANPLESNKNVPPPTESEIHTTITEDMDSSEEPSSQMPVIDIASQTTNVSSLAVVHSDSSADTLIIDSDQELF